MRHFHLGALALSGLVAMVLIAPSAAGQRGAGAELDLDEVDLDAPDPAEKTPKTKREQPPDAGTVSPAGQPTGQPPGQPTAQPSTSDSSDPANASPGAAPPDGPPTGSSPSEPRIKRQMVGDGSRVFLQQMTFENLRARWDARAEALRRGESGRAKLLLKEFDAALREFGLQGVPGGFHADSVAIVLVREAEAALEEDDPERARALVEVAERAAPDLVAVYTTRALAKWQLRDLHGTIDAMMNAVRCHVRDPLTFSQVLARVLALALLMGVFVMTLIALLAGVPALRYLIFDVLHALPRGAHRGQVAALVLLVALAPAIAGAGPLLGSLWILTLSWLYLPARTRMVAFVLGLACFALPAALTWEARLIAYPDTRAARAHAALLEAEANGARHGLSAQLEASLDVYEQAALALAARREGRLDEAAQRYQKLLAREDVPFAHGAYGIVLGLVGREELALAEFNKVAAEEAALAAAYNVSVLHSRAGRFEKATATTGSVAKVAPDLLSAYRRATFREADQPVGQNREFVDVLPSTRELLRHGLAPSDVAQEVETALRRMLLRGLDESVFSVLLAVLVTIWLALLVVRKRLAPARSCGRCGNPASRRHDGRGVPEGTCGQCFHAFISTQSRVDALVKQKKEREIFRRLERRRRIARMLGWLWPGAGHLYAGAALSGTFLAMSYGFAIGAVAFSTGLLPLPRLDGGWSDTSNFVAASMLLLGLWLVGLRSSWRVADRAAAGRK